MKKTWILRVMAGLLLTLLVTLVVLALSLGTILKRAVERIGPNATLVDVKIKGAGVWLLAWRVELTEVVLGNPPGYTTPTSIAVEDVTVRIKPRSVFSNKLIVDTIYVRDPVITLEGGLRDNNLKKIEKNLDDYIGSSSTAPNTTAPPASPAAPERKLQVNDVLIVGAKLQVKTKFTAGRLVTLPLPNIHLSNLGSGPEGITSVEVSQRVLHEILITATAEVAKNTGKLGEVGAHSAEGAAKKAGDFFKKLFH